MKLIIAGGRDIAWEVAYAKIVEACRQEDSPTYKELIEATEIVSGTCSGVDVAGEDYAEFYEIPVKRFKPDWTLFGKAAGPLRNREMAKYGDALLLIWDGKSAGSKSMKEEMEKLSKPIYEVIIEGDLLEIK